MIRLLRSPLHLLLWLCAAVGPVCAFEFPAHSVSTSQQFTVFAEDIVVRSRVAGFAEENKEELLSLLGMRDNWRTPILISLRKADPSAPRAKASQVTLFDTGSGMKLQIDVCLEAAPDDIALQSRLVEALLLELAYREKSPRHGQAYHRPPAWLIEGVTERIWRKMLGGSPEVFETLLDANHLPPLATFLESAPTGLASTWTRVFRSGSLALLDQIVDLPNGRKSLVRLIEHIPESEGDAMAELQSTLVSVGDSEAALEKWWSLSLAKMAAANRYQGSSMAETERRLSEILTMKLKNLKGEEQTYQLEEFRKFVKEDGAKAGFGRMSGELVQLSARGNALYRGIVNDYNEIAGRLARRKTRGLEERLTKLSEYRKEMRMRIDDIADYLNWMEGTQLSVKSSAFEGYFNAANELERWRSRRSDPVTAYMNLVEKTLPPPAEMPGTVAQEPLVSPREKGTNEPYYGVAASDDPPAP